MDENMLKTPLEYDGHDYIFDTAGSMVAEIRGWSEIYAKYGHEKAVEIQNARAEYIVASVNRCEKSAAENIDLTKRVDRLILELSSADRRWAEAEKERDDYKAAFIEYVTDTIDHYQTVHDIPKLIQEYLNRALEGNDAGIQ